MGQFATDYIDVAARLVEFRKAHPEGSLQPADLARPFWVENIGGKDRIVVVAAAYRTPDDPRPGIGMAYEEVPGKTQFTRDSELQNAETSAWGRAIVAALAADTKKGIASAEEVRNRQAERTTPRERGPVQRPTGVAAEAAKHDRDLRGKGSNPPAERGVAAEDPFAAPEWATPFRTRLAKAMTPEALEDRWAELQAAVANGEVSPEWGQTLKGEIAARKAHLEAEDAKPEAVA